MDNVNKKRIAIFASGAGSNAANLIQYFRHKQYIEIALIVSNNPNAGVIHIANDNHLPIILIEKERFFRGDGYIPELVSNHIDYIVLAGFLWKIPLTLINAFPYKIINIHPALLPKYGGKGMYGAHVHQAIIDNHEIETGITIHLVDEIYDNGKILFQVSCPVMEHDTPETVAHKVHQLEYAHFPIEIEKWLMNQ